MHKMPDGTMMKGAKHGMSMRKQPKRFQEGGHAEESEGWKTQDKLIDAAIFGAGLLTPRGAIKRGIGRLGKSVAHWADDAAEAGGKAAKGAAKGAAEASSKSAASAGRMGAAKAFGENAAKHEGRSEMPALPNRALKGGNRTFERDEEPEVDRKFSMKDEPRKVGRADISDDSDTSGSRKALGYSKTPSVIHMGTEPDSTWKDPGVVRTTDTAAEAAKEAKRKKAAKTRAANKAKKEAADKLNEELSNDDFSGGMGMSGKRGGLVKRSSASSRGDGIAKRGHTRGRYV